MKTITKAQELQLIGLQALSETHVAALNDIESAACAITGDVAGAGTHTSDMLWGSRTVPELLTLLGIAVAEDAPEAK